MFFYSKRKEEHIHFSVNIVWQKWISRPDEWRSHNCGWRTVWKGIYVTIFLISFLYMGKFNYRWQVIHGLFMCELAYS
jgi:hypothetical protein